MNYRYRAYADDKRLVEGAIEAATETLAEDALYQAGFKYIVHLKAVRSRATAASVLPTLFGVKPQDIIDFSRQVAVFLESGVSLYTALQLVEDQTAKPPLRALISGLARDLQEGRSFSQAVGRHPEVFSHSYRQIIAASEKAGDLESGLKQIAGYMEKQLKMVSNIRRATAYPATVTAMAVGVFILMVTVVLPPILRLFESLGAELPWSTRLVIFIVGFFSSHKFQLLIGVLCLVGVIVATSRLPNGRLALDRLKLRLPLIGNIIIQRSMGQFCRTCAMMLKAGLQLPETMEVAIQAAGGNRIVSQALTEVRARLVEGQGLSRPMSENALFPRAMVRMMAMGEKTGGIDTALNTMANYYEERSDRSIQALISMIEPVLTVVLGLAVAFILVSILMPMYTVLNSVR